VVQANAGGQRRECEFKIYIYGYVGYSYVMKYHMGGKRGGGEHKRMSVGVLQFSTASRKVTDFI
jgi:hypothetical protein